MTSLVLIPPDDQARALSKAYAKAAGAQRWKAVLGLAVLTACIALAWVGAEVNPAKLWANADKFTAYFQRLAHLDDGRLVWMDVREWFWGLPKWSRKLGETLLIAYIGTMLGALAALILCFLAAGNLGVSPWLQFSARRLLEFCRTVPGIVFALIFVVAFGLGPLPGVLAVAIHSAGALGKLFSEVVENIDLKAVEGLKSTGATWTQTVRFAVLPQVASSFASYGLLRFEINVRESAIMGFVGAGGIGQDLLEAVRKFYYSDVSAILLMIVLTIVIIDLATEQLRQRFLDAERN